jgi:hypothetical protein
MKPKKAFFASQADLAFKREIGTYGVNIRQWKFGWHNRLDRAQPRRAEDNAGRGMVLIGGARGRVRAARPLGTVISGPASNQGGGYSDHR